MQICALQYNAPEHLCPKFRAYGTGRYTSWFAPRHASCTTNSRLYGVQSTTSIHPPQGLALPNFFGYQNTNLSGCNPINIKRLTPAVAASFPYYPGWTSQNVARPNHHPAFANHAHYSAVEESPSNVAGLQGGISGTSKWLSYQKQRWREGSLLQNKSGWC